MSRASDQQFVSKISHQVISSSSLAKLWTRRFNSKGKRSRCPPLRRRVQRDKMPWTGEDMERKTHLDRPIGEPFCRYRSFRFSAPGENDFRVDGKELLSPLNYVNDLRRRNKPAMGQSHSCVCIKPSTSKILVFAHRPIDEFERRLITRSTRMLLENERTRKRRSLTKTSRRNRLKEIFSIASGGISVRI